MTDIGDQAEDTAAVAAAFNAAATKLLEVTDAALAEMRRQRRKSIKILKEIEARLDANG